MKKLFVWLASASICAAQAISIGPFATEGWVEDRLQVLTNDFATVSYVDDLVNDVEDKIPDVSGFATKSYVDAVSNAIPDTASFATKEYVDAVSNAIPDVTGLATKAYVDAVSNAIPDTSTFSTVDYVNTTSNNLALLIDDLVSEEELGSSVSNIVPAWALVPIPPVTVEVDPAFTNWLATTNVVIDDNVGAFVSNVVPSWALVPIPPVTVEVDPAFTNWLATTNNVWLWQEPGDSGSRFLRDSTGTNLINLNSLGYMSSVEIRDPIGDPLYVPTVYSGSSASTSGFGVYVDDSNTAQPVVLYSNGSSYSLRDNCVGYYYRPGRGEYGDLILKTRYEDIPVNRFVKCNLGGSGPYLYIADRDERYFLPTNDVSGEWVLARTNDIPYLVTTESIGALSAVDHASGNFIEWDGSGNLYTTIGYFQFLSGDYNTAYSAEDVYVDGNALVWPRDKAGVIALTNDIPSTNGLATVADATLQMHRVYTDWVFTQEFEDAVDAVAGHDYNLVMDLTSWLLYANNDDGSIHEAVGTFSYNDDSNPTVICFLEPTEKYSDLYDEFNQKEIAHRQVTAGYCLGTQTNKLLQPAGNYVDVVTNATAGNIAAIDTNGNLIDSGVSTNLYLRRTGGTMAGPLDMANYSIHQVSPFGKEFWIYPGMLYATGGHQLEFTTNGVLKAGTVATVEDLAGVIENSDIVINNITNTEFTIEYTNPTEFFTYSNAVGQTDILLGTIEHAFDNGSLDVYPGGVGASVDGDIEIAKYNIYLPESVLTFDSIAPMFSTNNVYTNGDFVIRNRHLYECTNMTSGVWAPANWKQTSVTEILGNLRKILDEINGEAL